MGDLPNAGNPKCARVTCHNKHLQFGTMLARNMSRLHLEISATQHICVPNSPQIPRHARQKSIRDRICTTLWCALATTNGCWCLLSNSQQLTVSRLFLSTTHSQQLTGVFFFLLQDCKVNLIASSMQMHMFGSGLHSPINNQQQSKQSTFGFAFCLCKTQQPIVLDCPAQTKPTNTTFRRGLWSTLNNNYPQPNSNAAG